MEDSRLKHLLELWQEDRLDQDRRTELIQYLQDPAHREQFVNVMDTMTTLQAGEGSLDEAYWLPRIQAIMQVDKPPVAKKTRLLWHYAAAAAVLLLASVGAYYWWNNEPPAIAPAAPIVQDIPAGSNKAVLTLGNGATIVLDSTKEGMLAQQGATRVWKKEDGQLDYQPDQQQADNILFNTLSTPRGGQYTITLPDGSKVWLNAASSLHYPTAFREKNRQVELTGEAYFEIAADREKPFRVKVNGMEIVVLGTHFNVMAYADEKTCRTTLLEGAVKLEKNAQQLLLRPGQEGRLQADKTAFTLLPANADEAVAWKNGLFHFEQADIQSIARQIARWYDVEVIFEGQMPTRRFMGVMSRNSSLNTVLKILEAADVHFKVAGKKLIITADKS